MSKDINDSGIRRSQKVICLTPVLHYMKKKDSNRCFFLNSLNKRLGFQHI